MKKWLWIIGILTLVSACLEEPDCLHFAESSLIISFKKLSDNKADTVIFYHITAESGGLLLSDTAFYKQPVDVLDTLKGKNAIVRVNPYGAETLFTFYFQNSVEKKLHVGYESTIRFISEDCGSERIQINLKILETNFDSVRVVNPILSRNATSNIEIFN